MLIVNLVTAFRVSIFQQFIGTSASLVERVIAVGFEEKAFSLFSLLFGIGLAIQFERLRLAGRPFYWLARRLLVLLVFGLIHLLLIWNGDILTEYAIAGLVAAAFLLLPPRGLLLAGFILLVLCAVGPMLYAVPWPDAATLQAHVAIANEVYAAGTFVEIRQFSLRELPLISSLHGFVFPRTLALFVLGMWLWRAGILRRVPDFSDEMIVVAVVGIAAGAALAQGPLKNPGIALWALGYGAVLVVLVRAWRPLVAAFAPIGRMAFTNYLMQSVIFGFVFFGYGLGQFGRMSAGLAVALGVGVYAAQMAFSRWWLGRYRYGPLEWLWRTLMYGRVPYESSATSR